MRNLRFAIEYCFEEWQLLDCYPKQVCNVKAFFNSDYSKFRVIKRHGQRPRLLISQAFFNTVRENTNISLAYIYLTMAFE
jgi:hypothetical protein